MAELLARLSCPGRLFLCFIPELYPRMELSIAKVHYNGNAYGIEHKCYCQYGAYWQIHEF